MPEPQAVREAIIECFRQHGGAQLTVRDVASQIEQHYPGQWKDVSTSMADLVVGGNSSSPYRDNQKCLVRVRRGVYRLSDCCPAGTLSARSGQQETLASVAGLRPPAQQPDGEAIEFWVPGIPATFATAAEKRWRSSLSESISAATNDDKFTGVDLHFNLEAMLRGGQPFDLDNLCEPIFSTLVNGKGWCGGRRPQISWWSAKRRIANPTGCNIRLASQAAPVTDSTTGIYDGTYTGVFPRRATDAGVAGWLQTTVPPSVLHYERFDVVLCFGTDRINLGNIASGPVKSIIDNLFPVIGGRVGAPEDWRIDRLLVRKGVENLCADSFRVIIAGMAMDQSC